MRQCLYILVAAMSCAALTNAVSGQETDQVDAAREKAEQVLTETRETAESIAADVDRSQTAQEVSAGILKPIYALAELLSFAAFHWLAFALMSAGVIGFALQLMLAKLVVLSKMSFSLREILSDALGLAISLAGLVLTTQAAAENSTFTHSPALVLSAAAAGILIGFIHYRWGQTAELQAAAGRKHTPATAK